MYVCSLCGSQVPKHECKPSLRDRCEKLFSDIMRVEFEKYSDLDMVDIQAIEAFAREIRNEALEPIKAKLGAILIKVDWNSDEFHNAKQYAETRQLVLDAIALAVAGKDEK